MSTLVFEDVRVRFGSGDTAREAVRGVSLTVPGNRTLGLVGESGSGKSTLARAAVGLHEPYAGRILVDGTDIARARGKTATLRRGVQMVFQDAHSCLNPRMSVGASIEEALVIRGRFPRRDRTARRREVARLLQMVQLDPDRSSDLPTQLSGGQRQRVAIARALAAEPQVLIADEVTSALDVSVQGAVLNLLMRVQRELDLTVLFISHNLAVVRQFCDEVAVMRAGEIVEAGPTVRVIDDPGHPYTRDLVRAVPRIGTPLFDAGTGR